MPEPDPIRMEIEGILDELLELEEVGTSDFAYFVDRLYYLLTQRDG